MSFARTIARKIFGKSIEILDLDIKFHTDANIHGSHGYLVASHVDKNLKNAQVRFVFVGLSEAPPMTPRIMDYIWEEAKAQGFLPHSLKTYGMVLPTHANIPTHTLVSGGQKRVEEANLAQPAALRRDMAVAGAVQTLRSPQS